MAPNTKGTDEVVYTIMWATYHHYDDVECGSKREKWMRQIRELSLRNLARMLNLMIGWCFNTYTGTYSLCVLYVKKYPKDGQTCLQAPPITYKMYSSGFVSGSRGIHWNRYNRLRRN